MDRLLWVVLPYAALAVFTGGLIWRYRYDRLGWTTRSSQLYEHRLLRWGSPLFHAGILLTVGGHVVGVLVPAAWTRALGVPGAAYTVAAVGLGAAAGACTVAGLAILLYRRVRVRAVARTTTAGDTVMFALLAATIGLGLVATLLGPATGNPHDYRGTVAPWYRSILALRPRAELMTGVPVVFQLHALVAWGIVAVWPFSRLVHAFGVPLGYLTRPYVVYRARGGPTR